MVPRVSGTLWRRQRVGFMQESPTAGREGKAGEKPCADLPLPGLAPGGMELG